MRNAPKESLFGVSSSKDDLKTLERRERDSPDSLFFNNILSDRKHNVSRKNAEKKPTDF